jgi:SRSO17 transposase
LLGSFQGRFRRPEGAEALARETTGRLTELPNNNGDTIAHAVPGTNEQRLQELLTTRQWDEEELNRQRGHQLSAEATRGDGVLVLDDTGVPQPGTASAGVARQDSGPLGQVGNCQVAVPCGAPDPQASWPVAGRLSWPQSWADAPTRRRKARVPAAVTFQTTPELALARLDRARAWGGPHRCVVADADDGDHPNCLAGREARPERSVAGVRADFQVVCPRQTTTAGQRADRVLAVLPRWPWRTMRWRQGTTGWRRKKCVAVRCWRVTSAGRRHVGWLSGERAPRGQPEERQYSWSNLPASATPGELAGYAPRRHAVEPCHEEATGELGGDQDQGRLWTGFPRHAVTAMRASSFLVWLERRQRRGLSGRGRPRDPFSPSPGPTAVDATGNPSGGRPVAPPPSRPVVGDNRSIHGTLLTQVLTKQY